MGTTIAQKLDRIWYPVIILGMFYVMVAFVNAMVGGVWRYF